MYVLGAPGLVEVYPFRLWPANTSLTIFAPDENGPPWSWTDTTTPPTSSVTNRSPGEPV